jgi:hypothetical protein
MTMPAAVAIIAFASLLAARVDASPNLSLDDPAYEQLAVLRALARIRAYRGGLAPLTRRRALQLIDGADNSPVGWWVEPMTRAKVRLSLNSDTERPYSTTARPRDIAGGVALSCEHSEGRPCGNGIGAYSEVDTSAGYGRWLTASLRVRGVTGTDAFETELELDRAYVSAELDAITVEVGRDVMVLGPSSRTQLAWGDHTAPLDHVRLSTSEPLRLSSQLRVNGAYVVGRLRRPQTYPGGYVSIMRAQLDIADAVELGTMQLLQLGGHGAPAMSFLDFFAEHVHRADATASASDSSNRRFGGDISLHIPELGARLYYALIFEDIRRARFIDAVRYDADQLFGIDVPTIALDPRCGMTIELHKTGVRSQEHTPRTTGFTNSGLAAGSPLGPDATSFYLGARIGAGALTVFPWIEYATLSSDTYVFEPYGPIDRLTSGPNESRYRLGTRARLFIRDDVRIEPEIAFERVQTLAFTPGSQRTNAGFAVSLTWLVGSIDHPATRRSSEPKR